ncbi:MAG: UDP-N-acetylmuramoyl-L-alanyl-D-glutamate--2,6-diaminopimelate ligase [Coraliomargaritaceae bacterium]
MNFPVDIPISTLLSGGFFSSRRDSSRSESFAGLPENSSIASLLKDVVVCKQKGLGEDLVTCLVTDSRRVVPGALFFAIGGLRTDGNLYIEEAVDRGAVGVISSQDLGSRFPIDYFQVDDVRVALAKIAKIFYGRADEALSIAGITGTNGKTTVSMLLQHLLGNEEKTGLIGTVRYDVGKRTLPAYRTTPESVDIHALFSEMVKGGCQRAIMEVSSHGIEQKRIYGTHIDVAVFLNLTQDHLDYHETMEAYYEAKKALFTGDSGTVPQHIVLNLDCSYGRRLLDELDNDSSVTTFGTVEGADLRASDVLLLADRTEFKLQWEGRELAVVSPLLGSYNVSNLLAALTTGRALGFCIEQMLNSLSGFSGVPGRMERVKAGQSFNLLVDYAHTDDALFNAAEMLRGITEGRLLIVFGCGGNRDRSKRAPMLKAALHYADQVFVTADNPRNEPLTQIFDDMKEGVDGLSACTFIEDRKRAISAAMDSAQSGDCVLIAGKGHETFQEFDGTVIPFDDRIVARELLELKSFNVEGG